MRYPTLEYQFIDIICNDEEISFKLCTQCIKKLKYSYCKCNKINNDIIYVNNKFDEINCKSCIINNNIINNNIDRKKSNCEMTCLIS